MTGTGKRVVVAMSGGVDSSTAACLLKEQGWDVIGISMKLFTPGAAAEACGAKSCCGVAGIQDARRVCQVLDVPFYALDYSKEFRTQVIGRFINEYRVGRTPNPCVECNRHIKFGLLLDAARKLDAPFLATGHYARITRDPGSGRAVLSRSADPEKDQTYFLYCLNQEQLQQILFPLEGHTKAEVRRIAATFDLHVHDKPGSMEICFVEDDYRDFLAEACPELLQEGDIVDADGAVLGRHRGVAFYTIGQRRGLGIAAPHPLYVNRLDYKNNRVVVSENSGLAGTSLVADQLILTDDTVQPWEMTGVTAQIRYRSTPVPVTVSQEDADRVRVTFTGPQRAITPGQAVVFYHGQTVLGGGTIHHAA